MTAEIDDLFRRFQADLGPLPTESRRRILAQAMTGKRDRKASRRPGRLVVVVASLAGVAAVTTAAVVVRHLDDSAALPADAPRVEWGQSATVRVIPDPGVSDDIATERAIQALRSRAAERDVPGVRLERVGSDTLRMTVPGAIDRFGPQQIIGTVYRSIAIFDRRSGRIASYSTPEQMKAGLPKLTPSGGYLLVPRSWGGFTGAEWVATRQEADKQLKFLNATVLDYPERQWEAIRTPAGAVRLIASESPSRLDVVPDRPALTAADITRVDVDDVGRMILTVSHDGGERIAAAAARGDLVAVVRSAGPYSTLLGPIAVRTDGRLAVTLDPMREVAARRVMTKYLVQEIGSPPIPAELRVASSNGYGTRPPLQGERVATLPAIVEEQRRQQWDPRGGGLDPLTVPADAVLRVLSATHDGRDVSIYATRTAYGDEIAYFARSAGAGNVCQSVAGPESLTVCTGDAGRSGTVPVLGRIGDPAITRVEVRTRSGLFPATVDNGWYQAFVPGPDLNASKTIPPSVIVGMDEHGDVLAERNMATGAITRRDRSPTG